MALQGVLLHGMLHKQYQAEIQLTGCTSCRATALSFKHVLGVGGRSHILGTDDLLCFRKDWEVKSSALQSNSKLAVALTTGPTVQKSKISAAWVTLGEIPRTVNLRARSERPCNAAIADYEGPSIWRTNKRYLFSIYTPQFRMG